MPSQPQKTPVVQKPTPVVLDQILIETEDSNAIGTFDRMLEYGHYHPEQVKYPGHRLLKQGPNSYGQYQRIWGNDLTAQDGYNVAKDYAEQSNSHPIFVRSYRVLRSDYLVNGPLTKLTAFTGVAGVHVTAGGADYTKDFAVTGSGGAGTGFAGTAIVNRGAVVRIEITNVGSGYTSAPTVVLSAGDGTGATATAVIQPATALLVSERHSKLPEDDPYSSLYDLVVRVYETLPGPVLAGKTMSDAAQGAVVNTSKQVLATAAAAYTVDWKTLAYTDTPLDTNRKERFVVTMPDANFPALVEYDVDTETMGDITFLYSVVQASAIPGSPAQAPGYLTRIKKIDKWRSLQINEIFATPATYEEQRFSAFPFPSLFDYTQYIWSDVCGAFSTEREGFSAHVKARMEISFSDEVEEIDGLTLIPNSISMGKGIRKSNILNDAGELEYTGECTGTIEFGASDPTLSEYLALIGTEQLITGESVRLKSGLYQHSRLYITMI